MIEKRFPANTSLELETTFLKDKKIDAELYAVLQEYSYPVQEEKDELGFPLTVVDKADLPAQTDLCGEDKQLKMSVRTYRYHLKYLIEKGYVIDDTKNKRFILPRIEDVYMLLPQKTISFINTTITENVIKIYIYLGQRWNYKKNYSFSQEEVAQHLGISLSGNKKARDSIRFSLIALQNHGLISYKQVYVGKIPQYILTNWSVNFVERDPIILQD